MAQAIRECGSRYRPTKMQGCLCPPLVRRTQPRGRSGLPAVGTETEMLLGGGYKSPRLIAFGCMTGGEVSTHLS